MRKKRIVTWFDVHNHVTGFKTVTRANEILFLDTKHKYKHPDEFKRPGTIL